MVWRVLSPGDVRLNRVYLSRYLKDGDGNGPRKLSVKRIPVVIPAGQPEEKVCYHVEASFADGSHQQLTAQVFYPLEALQMERDKQRKPLVTDDLNPTSQLSGSPSTPHSDEIDKLKEDPLKEINEEYRIVEQKTGLLQAEIEQLRLLNQYTDFFPKFINHDVKKHITLMGAVGATRLDDLLNQKNVQEGTILLRGVVENLARFHKEGQIIADNLLPGMSHNEELIRSQISGALQGFVLAGVDLSEVDIHEAIDAARVLIDISTAEVGPKLMDASPRAFFSHLGVVRPLDFGRVRSDISAIDVVELLCDPSTGISPEAEMQLYEHYSNTRFEGVEEQALQLQILLRLGIYYRMVLSGFLVMHLMSLAKPESRQRPALEIKYWTPAALPRAVESLKFFLAQDPELARLHALLAPKLDELAKYK